MDRKNEVPKVKIEENKLTDGLKRDKDEYQSERLRTNYKSEYDIMRALHLH